MSASAPPDPRARRVVALVFVTVFLDLVGFGIIIPQLPLYVESMGGKASTAGILLSCFAATQLVATPILGRLSDRVGRRKVILVSLAGNAASMVLFALASRLAMLPLLFASRILAGATAGNLAACQAAIADVTVGDERAKGMGRLGAGIGLGLIIGPALGSQLLRFGAWAPPLGAAAMAFADLVAVFAFMPETHDVAPVSSRGAASSSKAPPGAQPSVRRILSQPRLIVVLAIYFFTFLYMTNMQTVLAFLCKVRFGWGGEEMSYCFLLFGAIMFVVQGLLIQRIARAFGDVRVVLAGSLMAGSGLIVIAYAATVPVMIAGLALLGLGLGVTQPLLATIASQFAGRRTAGAVLGVAQSVGGAARTAGPTLNGYLYEIAVPVPFLVGAGSALLAFLLALTLREPPPAEDA